MDSIVLSDWIARLCGAILGFTFLLIALSRVCGLLAGFALRSRTQRVIAGYAIAVTCLAALLARAATMHAPLMTSSNVLAAMVGALVTLGLSRRRVRKIREREAGSSSMQPGSPATACAPHTVSPVRQVVLWSGVAAVVLLITFYGRPVSPDPSAVDITHPAADLTAEPTRPDAQTPPAPRSADIVAGVSEFERTFKTVGFDGTSAVSNDCYESVLPAIDHADRPWSAIDRCMAFDLAADQFAQGLVNMGISGGATADAYFGHSLAVQSARSYISHGMERDVLIERIKLMEPLVRETRGTTRLTFGDVEHALDVAGKHANRAPASGEAAPPVQSDSGLPSGSLVDPSGEQTGTVYGRDQLVSGYTRSNGTVVQPYHRTAPDSTMANNYSARGNINPYTGQSGHVQARH